MIECNCGKPMDKVPNWLGSVKVQFVCNNCPNRTIKGITEVSLSSTEVKENSHGALDEGFADTEDEDEDED